MSRPIGTVSGAELGRVEREADPGASFSDGLRLGLMLDVGVPDGINLGAAWDPYPWLRIHGGASFNLMSLGFRGGLGWLPFRGPVIPALVLEGGYLARGDLRGLLGDEITDGLPDDLSYLYANAQLGIEVGDESFTFYLRGGYSAVFATFTPATSDGEGLRFEDQAQLWVFLPSAKLGLMVYLE